MASIRKRTPWRIVVDKDTANAVVFDTLKKAVAAAKALVAQGTALGFVQEPRKGLTLGPGTALVERVPGGSWEVRIRSKFAPELVKSFARKSDADDWTAQREGEIAKRQFVDYREADRNTLGDLLMRFSRDRLQGRPEADPDKVRTTALAEHVIGRIRMSALQASDIAAYRDERVKVVKGATVKKELELVHRVIAIARLEWGIHMAANPASGKLVKRPAPQDGDVRDRRLAEVHVGVKESPPPAPDPAGQGALPAKSGPASRRVRPDDAYEDEPETTELLAMPQSEQQALLRACRYPAWFTQRKRDVTAATLQARLKRKAKAPPKARLQKGCRLWAMVSFAIETAMRRGEMVNLRWSHVHLRQGYLELPASITKNGKPRIVPLSVRALRILTTQPRSSELVFDTNVNTVKLAFKRARARVGSFDLRLHDLRHEGTSRLFEKTDLRPNEIGHVTGHTDPRMLERYYNKRPGEFVARFRSSFK